MKFELDPELRKYLEYVRDSYLQLNTNNRIVKIGSRGEILHDAINDLTATLAGKEWREGYTNANTEV